MITSEFLKSLSEDEQSLLYYILYSNLRGLGYEPSFELVRFLRKDVILKHLSFLKTRAKEEFENIFEELKNKIVEYNK